jgi:FixJ family two-component response regulator
MQDSLPSTCQRSVGSSRAEEGRFVLTAAAVKQAATICLVEDDPSVIKATSRLLSSEGWRVESFLDPLAFLRYAQTHRPEVAVIDILMPIMNGLEVQTRLRTLSPATRVIVLTANDDPAVRSKATASGALAFLVKPADDEEFLSAVESAASAR